MSQYAFQWFATATANTQEYTKRRTAILERYFEINDDIFLIIFDNNESNHEKLIFHIDFLYQNGLYNIIAIITPSLLSIIDINIEIFDENENIINNPAVEHEAICSLYDALLKKYDFEDFED